MSKVAIMTDSNSGITQKEAKKLGVYVIPMPFLMGDETYYEDINLTQEGFYEKIQFVYVIASRSCCFDRGGVQNDSGFGSEIIVQNCSREY